MLDQSYSKKALRLFQRKIKMKGMTIKKRDKLLLSLDKISKSIQNSSYTLNDLNSFIRNNDTIWRTNNHEEILILKYTLSILKKVFKLKQANRNIITNQIIQLLSSGQSFSIIRADIKSFYESVPVEKVISEIIDKSIISKQVKYVLTKVHQQVGSPKEGLPRGICYSPLLAELYMREFDNKIQSQESIFYYARYVDDIIIFTTDKKSFNINNLKEVLPNELSLNKKKTFQVDIICRCKIQCQCSIGSCNCSKRCKCARDTTKYKHIDYLGYRYTFPDIPVKENKKKNSIEIRIAEAKIKKIKSRIVLSFLAFINNNNYALLKDRIKFLTSNYFVYENISDSNLKSGIYYSYPALNSNENLKDLDIFLRKIIFAKNKSFGSKINSKLTSPQKTELSKYSFEKGYTNRRMVPFTSEEIGTIKNCWIYE